MYKPVQACVRVYTGLYGHKASSVLGYMAIAQDTAGIWRHKVKYDIPHDGEEQCYLRSDQ